MHPVIAGELDGQRRKQGEEGPKAGRKDTKNQGTTVIGFA
jgi:hypothetical protein